MSRHRQNSPWRAPTTVPVLAFWAAYVTLVASGLARGAAGALPAQAPFSGSGPAIARVTNAPSPQPAAGVDIPITATVLPESGGDVQTVTLIYLVNYGPEQQVPMVPGPGGYLASIPAAAFKAGDMVRWFVQASDTGGQTARSPPAASSEDAQYFGTVIADPSISSNLPILHWFTDDAGGSITTSGAPGSNIYFLGRFYDNVFVKRKGVTSLSWPKPKLKFTLGKAEFVLRDPPQSSQEGPVKKFELNSIYWEPGQHSYMREAIAYQVMREVGVPTPIYYHIVVYQNGQYYGLHTLVEDVDARWLKRTNQSVDGILFQSKSGDHSNLRWDVTVDQLPYYYDLEESRADNATTYGALADLTRGIAGGSGVPRSKWVFDNIDLPETLNYMAVATMLLYQDRCTKNWFILRDNSTGNWRLLPHDLKTALGADSGLGGTPAPDYCILECEQWNSPLYCDRNHPQDLPPSKKAPWTSITTQSLTGRRLVQTSLAAGPTSGFLGSAGPAASAAYVDEDLTTEGPTKTGAAGTYNYLIDLILAVPATRAAYLRRLRSVSDQYHNGRLLQMVTDLYNQIRAEAKRDDAKWRAGDIDSGYQQLMTEQIPVRKAQLYGVYGPGGAKALLPDAQPALTGVGFGRVDAGTAPAQQYIEIVNPSEFAVDLTGWTVRGSVNMDLQRGTVIPPTSSLYLTPDVNGFRQRSSPPTKGQGAFVQGSLSGPLSAGGSAVNLNLLDASGNTISTKSGPTQDSVAG